MNVYCNDLMSVLHKKRNLFVANVKTHTKQKCIAAVGYLLAYCFAELNPWNNMKEKVLEKKTCE